MSPCRKCEAKCCRYFALEIDTPKSKAQFEDVRWYLAHKNVSVFVEKRKWFVEIMNECSHITGNHTCGIYEKRPLVCREHSVTSCEQQVQHFDHDMVFKSIDEVDLYMEKRFPKRKKTVKKTGKGTGKHV